MILDDLGQEQRWQEGMNMILKIPTTYQGLPVQRYDVGVSWCKTCINCRAHPAVTSACAVTKATSDASTAGIVASLAGSVLESAFPLGHISAAAPVMPWALSKGANPVNGWLNPAVAAQAAGDSQPRTQQRADGTPILTVAAVASAQLGAAQPYSGYGAQPSSCSDPLPLPEEPLSSSASGGSKAAALFRAALGIVQMGSTTEGNPSPDSTLATSETSVPLATGELWTSFQLMAAVGDSQPKMSIVLPSRSRSPPVKISLSSNFARLMEIPAITRANNATTRQGANGNGASAVVRGTPSQAASAVQGITISSGAEGVASSSKLTESADATVSTIIVGDGQSLAYSAQPPAAAPPTSDDAFQIDPRHLAISSAIAPASPMMWGMEYDIYASAYGLPYMHTPFDLNAYAVYEQELSSSVSATVQGATHGSASYLSSSQAHGADPLESAVEAAHGSTFVKVSHVLSAPNTSTSAGAGPVAAPVPPPCAADVVLPRPADPVVTAPVDDYRQASQSSTTISDWAGRTLIDLSSSRSLTDEDSDEDETADEEAAVAQALTAPAAPADMAALLTQLGTALGRSVRLRYDGIDATAQDLLELDRKVALASSKLYRQRDNLLSGWVRKETRRQLASAAAAPATRPPLPTSNTVIPV